MGRSHCPHLPQAMDIIKLVVEKKRVKSRTEDSGKVNGKGPREQAMKAQGGGGGRVVALLFP